MKKLLTILLLLALVCIGFDKKDGRTESVAVPSENVYDAEEESAVIASEESLIEDGEDDIAVGTDTEQESVEQKSIEKKETEFTE